MEIKASESSAAEAAAASNQIEYVTAEQYVYARLLDWGMKAGLAMLVVTFGIYVLGIAKPLVPLDDLPKYWSMPVSEYLTAVGAGTGWSWVRLVGYGDFMNFIGIAFLSAVTIFCYLRILPFPVKSRDMLFGSIVVVEVLVLVLGASGILAAGH